MRGRAFPAVLGFAIVFACALSGARGAPVGWTAGFSILGSLLVAWSLRPRRRRRCRLCGCTDLDCRGCVERTGTPCVWVAPDLCSACVEEAHFRRVWDPPRERPW